MRKYNRGKEELNEQRVLKHIAWINYYWYK